MISAMKNVDSCARTACLLILGRSDLRGHRRPSSQNVDEAIRAADAAHMLSLRIAETDRIVPQKLDRGTVFAV